VNPTPRQAPWPPDVTLRGEHASLVPLSAAHGAGLAEAVRDGELWKLWYTSVASPDDMAADIGARLAKRAQSAWLPFAVIDRASERPIGMTNYLNIDPVDRHLEIGATWYRRSAQRTAVNTECKFLLLRHAFEALDCIAVEFRTHFFNTASRRAIERLGPSSTASCAITAVAGTAICATPASIRSSPRIGRQYGGISSGGWKGRGATTLHECSQAARSRARIVRSTSAGATRQQRDLRRSDQDSDFGASSLASASGGTARPSIALPPLNGRSAANCTSRDQAV